MIFPSLSDSLHEETLVIIGLLVVCQSHFLSTSRTVFCFTIGFKKKKSGEEELVSLLC